MQIQIYFVNIRIAAFSEYFANKIAFRVFEKVRAGRSVVYVIYRSSRYITCDIVMCLLFLYNIILSQFTCVFYSLIFLLEVLHYRIFSGINFMRVINLLRIIIRGTVYSNGEWRRFAFYLDVDDYGFGKMNNILILNCSGEI